MTNPSITLPEGVSEYIVIARVGSYACANTLYVDGPDGEMAAALLLADAFVSSDRMRDIFTAMLMTLPDRRK